MPGGEGTPVPKLVVGNLGEVPEVTPWLVASIWNGIISEAGCAAKMSASDFAQFATHECAREDLAHSSLISAGMSGRFLTCTYSHAGQCAYSKDGFFSSGSATCPNAVSEQNNIYAAASTICPKTDNGGSKLVGSGVSGGRLKTCTYLDAGLCAYFSDGLFFSGGSDCPDNIIPSSCICPGSSPALNSSGHTSPQDDAVIAGFDSGASGKRADGFNPAFMALLILNVALVVIVLTLGTMLIRARRTVGTSSRVKTRYAGLDVSGPNLGLPSRSPWCDGAAADKDASIPLAHDGGYSDAHE
ncbi:hypothetical protein B0H12DRAFT_1323269 [Mycena haematopus]|nr:hypothetical protein B0H12DRAFT_1323269 [Mycena haematopus]